MPANSRARPEHHGVPGHSPDHLDSMCHYVRAQSVRGLRGSLQLIENDRHQLHKLPPLALDTDQHYSVILVIDELGYLPMSKQGMYNLFQLINAMYEHRSLIITTNKDFTSWHEFFFDDNVAVPIVDRIIHHSKIFMLGGESYRLRHKLNNQGGQF